MPKEVYKMSEFLQLTRLKGAKKIWIEKYDALTKFRVRCPRCLYTIKVKEKDKADKLEQSLPPSIPTEVEIPEEQPRIPRPPKPTRPPKRRFPGWDKIAKEYPVPHVGHRPLHKSYPRLFEKFERLPDGRWAPTEEAEPSLPKPKETDAKDMWGQTPTRQKSKHRLANLRKIVPQGIPKGWCGNNLSEEYSIPGLFVLVSLLFVLLGLKKSCSILKRMQGLKGPLLHG